MHSYERNKPSFLIEKQHEMKYNLTSIPDLIVLNSFQSLSQILWEDNLDALELEFPPLIYKVGLLI